MEVISYNSVQSPPPPRYEENLNLLVETGILLASERSLDVVIQAALEAGLRLSGATFGAFFYTNTGDGGQPYHLHKIVGLDPSLLDLLPMPGRTKLFDVTFLGHGTIRSPDITLDSRYGHNLPLAGLPPGHPPVRSYLAIPVRSRGGEVLGGLIYGHPETNVFTPSSEGLVATVASQAAAAIDNVRLAESLTREIARVDASRALQLQTASRLRQALDAEMLGTWTWDRATDLLDLDERAAHLFSSRPHAPITRTELREGILATDDRAAVAQNLRSSLETGSLYSAEYRIEAPGGIQTWVSARGIPTFAPGSSIVTGMAGTVQDITVRKNQEAALRLSEKLAATGRLAATIAHEINNPLEAVTNLIYLSRTDPDVPRPVQRLLETADAELARVSQIAQQTLGFYRDTTLPCEIHFNELIHSVVDLFARKMNSHKINYTLDLHPDLRIHGLRGEMRQVFSNLIVNAIDAFTSIPRPGHLHIRGRHLHGSRNRISILICDDATGMPAQVRERIFSPFFTTKQSVGTGLGLWVTRGFIEKQGGSIRFRTRTGDSAGTIFRVLLPVNLPANGTPTHPPMQDVLI